MKQRWIALLVGASCFLGTITAHAEEDSSDPSDSGIRIAAGVMNVLGAGMILTAGALELASIRQAEHEQPGPRYARLERSTRYLAGFSVLVNVTNIPLGWARENDVPSGVLGAALAVGIPMLISGFALWAMSTEKSEPGVWRSGGTVLFSAGLPLAIWGGSTLLLQGYGRAMGTGG